MSNTDRYTVADNIEHFTIADLAEANPDFRQVVWTGEHAQIVVVNVPVGGPIGEEVHKTTDQILTFVSGTGEAELAGHTHRIGLRRPVRGAARHAA